MSLRALISGLLLGLLLLRAQAGEAPADQPRGAEWPQFKGGPGFTGVSPDDSVKPPLKLVWSYRTDGEGPGDGGGGVIVAGGRLFQALSTGRSILALDAATGRFLWEYAHKNINARLVAAHSRGRLYVWLHESRTPSLIALDASSGKPLWEVPLKSSGWAKTGVGRTSLPVCDGRIFCVDGGDEPAVIALDERTGKQEWRTLLETAAGKDIVPPCVAGGRVLLGVGTGDRYGMKGSTLALEAATGKVLWKRPDLCPWVPLSSDGKVAACSAGQLHLLDAETGKTLWTVGDKKCSRRTPTITDSLVMTKGYGSNFAAYGRTDGKLLWRFDGKCASGCCTPSISGGHAYFGQGSPGVGGMDFCVWFEKGRAQQMGWSLHAIDLKSGKSVWNYQMGFNVCGEPAIACGRVYASSWDGRIYCFAPVKEGETAEPEALDRSPKAPAEDVRKLLAADAQLGRGWPMEGGNPERAGLEGVTLRLPLEPAWEVAARGRVLTSPAVCDGAVYVGSDGGEVFAVQAASGKPVWEHRTGAPVRCSPAVAGGLVYCGSDDRTLYALDAATGAVRWKYACGGPVRGSPAIVGGAVVFAASDHHAYALDRLTGKKLWSFRTGHPQVEAAPVVHGDSVFVGEANDWVHCLDVATGEPKWKTFKPKNIEAMAFYREKLWVRGIYSVGLDGKSGKIAAYVPAPYGYNRPAFPGGTMLVAGPEGIAAFDLDAEGNKKAGFPAPAPRKIPGARSRMGSTGTPLGLGRDFCLATRPGELLIADPDGTVLWTARLGGTCHASPVAAAGMLVVGCDDGRVYAFREKAR